MEGGRCWREGGVGGREVLEGGSIILPYLLSITRLTRDKMWRDLISSNPSYPPYPPSHPPLPPTMYFLSYQISRQSDWNYPELPLRFCFPISQNFRIAISFKNIMRFFLPNFWEPPKLFFGSLPKKFFGSLLKFSVLQKCCRLPKFGSLPAFWSLLKLLNVML